MQLIIDTPDEKVLQAILELIRPYNVTLRQVNSQEPELTLPDEKKLPTSSKQPLLNKKPRPTFGSAKGKYLMAADFDAPLEVFKV